MGIKQAFRKAKIIVKQRVTHPLKRRAIRKAAKEGPTLASVKRRLDSLNRQSERNEQRYGDINVRLQRADEPNWEAIEKLEWNAHARRIKLVGKMHHQKIRTAATYAMRAAGIHELKTKTTVLQLLFQLIKWSNAEPGNSQQYSKNYMHALIELLGRKKHDRFQQYFTKFSKQVLTRT